MNKLRLAFSALFAAAIFGFFIYSSGPGMLRDLRLRGVETVEVASELTDGNCRVYLFANNFCSFDLRTTDAALEDMLFFVDIGGGGEGYDIVARAAANDPHQVTTSLALDMFWNRVATLAVFLGLIGFGFISVVGQLLQREAPPAT